VHTSKYVVGNNSHRLQNGSGFPVLTFQLFNRQASQDIELLQYFLFLCIYETRFRAKHYLFIHSFIYQSVLLALT
jgi:hypothetical protein